MRNTEESNSEIKFSPLRIIEASFPPRPHSYGGRQEERSFVRQLRSQSLPSETIPHPKILSASYDALDEISNNELERTWRWSRWGIFQRC